MTDTEILLQLWADTLADVQADKTFMQQVERDAQAAAFRVRAGAVRAEVMRRLQKAAALPGRTSGWTGHSPAVTIFWPMRRSGLGGTRGRGDTA